MHQATDDVSFPTISPLRGLVEVTRLLRAREDLPALLDAVARTIGESLGYQTVAVNLYRPQWDDFEVTTVYGNEAAKTVLLGNARPGEDWTVLLVERFERHGAYFVPSGAVDWDSLGPSYVPEGARACHPDAWDPEDALFVPMRDQRGLLLGILSVDEPVSGRKPTDDELEVLVSLVDHAALAVEAAREAAESARHQRALEELLAVSSRITGEPSDSEILRRVCTGIRDALDFRNVCAALVDAETGTVVPQATAGWQLDDLLERELITVAQVEPLLDEMFLREGCYLLTHDQALARIGSEVGVYPSQLNGRGPWAWNRHWLIVPLEDGRGGLLGIIWVDNPCDRLVPSADRLQALRIFANDAAAALVSGRHVGELRFLADHDPLTRLLNRRAFVTRLEGEVARAVRYGRSFGLAVADLDGFKQLNDRFGHASGDDALVAFANVLVESLRKPDDAFRIGGDEFAILLAEATDDDARQVVARVEALLEQLAAGGEPWAAKLSASFGCAAYPEDADDAQTLFRLADEALYDAKRAGTVLRFVARA
ncbi:MAG TPA: diguanylate cyclase [Gaiellaceae bacterium]|jgi:diguanylate cyclase (GGDEF)-like protein|nr:diguanylate cyclase [Gaiellaceae bacterium]